MFRYALLISIALLAASCGKKEEQHSKEILKIATSGDNPPYEFYKDGKLTGFDIELGHAIGKQLGKKVEFVDIPFDSIIASLQSQKVAMAMASIFANAERAKSVDFSNPYIENFYVLVTPGITDVNSAKDLAGKAVGAQQGSTFEHYGNMTLKKEVNVEIQTLVKLTDLLQNLKTGRIAGLIVGIPEADHIIANHPSFKYFKLPGDQGKACVALPKNSPLTAEVDKALFALEEDGTLDNLKLKWNLQ